MNLELNTLLLTIVFLSFLGLALFFRLFRIFWSRYRQPQKPSGDNLLFETLREQTLKEQEARQHKHQAQQAYASLEELHETVMAHLPTGVIVTSPDGLVKFANPAAREMLQLEDPQDVALNQLCMPLSEAYNHILENPAEQPRTFPFYGPQGEGMAELCLGSLPDDSFLLTIQDVTQVRLLEERVRTKRDLELMGEMASGITHEVKNALATISGHVQLLAYGDVNEHAEHMTHEINHLLKVVRLFMKTSKGEYLHPMPLKVEPWFKELEEHWKKHPSGASITIEIPPATMEIQGEKTLLSTVINNLLLNAVQSQDPAPAVRLKAQHTQRGVSLIVEDDGPGFPPETRSRMFAPFVSSKSGGTGLGLFQSRKIMMEHQGRLEVDHGPPTRVICHFPQDFAPTTPDS